MEQMEGGRILKTRTTTWKWNSQMLARIFTKDAIKLPQFADQQGGGKKDEHAQDEEEHK